MTNIVSILDIVIPVYGRARSLNQLIETLSDSIISNNLNHLINIIVVDDASPVPIKISQKKIDVILIRNNINSGAPISRNKGFLESNGKFVHFHDSDDSVSEDWLIEIVNCLQQKPDIDILLSARNDVDKDNTNYKFQKYFNKQVDDLSRVAKRLVYRNCMGPLGGVTFSRRVLEQVEFKNFASCQDWQMYIDAIKHAKVLVSRPDIKFIFNKTGDDRISHNPRKKILGHLQLARITGKKSLFGRNIRLFYLYTCKQHIYNKGGSILKLYKKNRLSIFTTFLIVSVYWRLT